MVQGGAGRGISFGFTAMIVVAFGAFLALGAISPATFARGVIGIIPLSVVLAAALIVGTVILTGVYVVIANRSDR
jgi:uncharacterized membrane protein (DUF485 family)